MLMVLASMFNEMLPGFPDGVFVTYFVEPAFSAVFPGGDNLSSELRVEVDALEPGESNPLGGLYLFALGCHYAADAVKAMNTENPQLAWTMICDAHYYRGMILEMSCNLTESRSAPDDQRLVVLEKIIDGAALGGRRSAEVRQANKKVPDADSLREERDSLISRGVPARNVAGLLAMRYGCTATHIRNQFNRN